MAIWSRPTGRRARHEMEYELLDTGVFDEDRYFDVFVEYAKESARRYPDSDHRVTTAVRKRLRSARAAHALVPQHLVMVGRAKPKPVLEQVGERTALSVITASHPRSGRTLPVLRRGGRRCCSPKTKPTRSGSSAGRIARPYVKDGINDYVVHGHKDAVNPQQTGTKAAAHYHLTVGRGETDVIRLRLSTAAPPTDSTACAAMRSATIRRRS